MKLVKEFDVNDFEKLRYLGNDVDIVCRGIDEHMKIVSIDYFPQGIEYGLSPLNSTMIVAKPVSKKFPLKVYNGAGILFDDVSIETQHVGEMDSECTEYESWENKMCGFIERFTDWKNRKELRETPFDLMFFYEQEGQEEGDLLDDEWTWTRNDKVETVVHIPDNYTVNARAVYDFINDKINSYMKTELLGDNKESEYYKKRRLMNEARVEVLNDVRNYFKNGYIFQTKMVKDVSSQDNTQVCKPGNLGVKPLDWKKPQPKTDFNGEMCTPVDPSVKLGDLYGTREYENALKCKPYQGKVNEVTHPRMAVDGMYYEPVQPNDHTATFGYVRGSGPHNLEGVDKDAVDCICFHNNNERKFMKSMDGEWMEGVDPNYKEPSNTANNYKNAEVEEREREFKESIENKLKDIENSKSKSDGVYTNLYEKECEEAIKKAEESVERKEFHIETEKLMTKDEAEKAITEKRKEYAKNFADFLMKQKEGNAATKKAFELLSGDSNELKEIDWEAFKMKDHVDSFKPTREENVVVYSMNQYQHLLKDGKNPIPFYKDRPELDVQFHHFEDDVAVGKMYYNDKIGSIGIDMRWNAAGYAFGVDENNGGLERLYIKFDA